MSDSQESAQATGVTDVNARDMALLLSFVRAVGAAPTQVAAQLLSVIDPQGHGSVPCQTLAALVKTVDGRATATDADVAALMLDMDADGALSTNDVQEWASRGSVVAE